MSNFYIIFLMNKKYKTRFFILKNLKFYFYKNFF